MSDYVTSLIRTVIPMVVGTVLTWLAAKGVVVDDATSAGLVAFLTGLSSAAYYVIARQLEARFPQFGWLLGVPKTPNYK